MVAELRKKNNQILICVDSDRIQNFFSEVKNLFYFESYFIFSQTV